MAGPQAPEISHESGTKWIAVVAKGACLARASAHDLRFVASPARASAPVVSYVEVPLVDKFHAMRASIM